MEYLIRGRERRTDPRLVFPQAQSVLSVAIPYPRNPAGASSESIGPKYARYLQGQDYHLEIAEKLERVMNAAKVRWNAASAVAIDSLKPPSTHANKIEIPLPELEWKICVDTSAVLERTWAARAGLGWIGKNTLLIHPQHGSYLFLAEVLINHKTGRGPALLPNLCGNCTRCLDSCPTNAIEQPGVLNSNSCIAYLTLEKRGELALDKMTQSKLGTWVAGCDVCQEVCPFNFKPTRKEMEGSRAMPHSSNATLLNQWRDLLLETSEQYKERVRHSAMKRVKPAQFSRNLAITLKNALTSELSKVNPLNRTSPEQHTAESGTREIYALANLVQSRLENEKDGIAQAEWKKCLASVQDLAKKLSSY
jgi:epoxyqueuosine reductase